MAREFEPFGVDYFQLDDGYQMADGDWFARADRFPSGMPAWSRACREGRACSPGSGSARSPSTSARHCSPQHPDWMARPQDNVLGPLLSPGSGQRVLDLSNPDVVDWLGDTMRRYTRRLGHALDQAGLRLSGPPLCAAGHPTLTSIEAYKRAIRKIRDTSATTCSISASRSMGMNYGVVDGMRADARQRAALGGSRSRSHSWATAATSKRRCAAGRAATTCTIACGSPTTTCCSSAPIPASPSRR